MPVILLASLLLEFLMSRACFTPDWESLDSRAVPAWFDEGKVGIFIHWGLYSVPSYGTEWFWKCLQSGGGNVRNFMETNFKPGFKYGEFAPRFTAEFFEPLDWAELFAASGARYVVLTSKHHDGFTLWPSALAFQWNAKAIGPHRDLVGDLFNAVRNKTKLRIGVYYSLLEWFHPLYELDQASNFSSSIFVKMKVGPELRELVEVYAPDIIWADGEWQASDDYWDSRSFLSWLYNDSPVSQSVVVNDRWGKESTCNHGGYITCKDRFNPKALQYRKWENAMTLDRSSWGYRREARLEDYLTTKELIQTLIETVAFGGNILINVGPTHDGRIAPIFEDRLRELGRWLGTNGEAIYGTNPWKHAQNDSSAPNVWYTASRDAIYALCLEWPRSGNLTLGAIAKPKAVTMLGLNQSLVFKAGKETLVELPLLQLLPSSASYAFVLRFYLDTTQDSPPLTESSNLNQKKKPYTRRRTESTYA